MKAVRFSLVVVLAGMLASSVTGCKRSPQGITPLPAPARVGPGEPPPGGIIGGPTGPGVTGTEVPSPVGTPLPPRGNYEGWPQDREALKAQTVYFDFDSAVIKSSERPKIDVVAAHLQSNPFHALIVEGHCDERGTEEYNRALGERRALAVREVLLASGIEPERIVTISYGEDRPVDPGHNEEAWRKNRRAEFVLLTPPR
ncbi:MAG: peptidoglycan-associated lipoprotein Pal [Verrucomicrobiota bacterium]|nr:peptidoglycan-associated lipoprotein Pal [Limisphaera sp.]MDW8382535.1 peptidoglycan-associated lipoprotein Pal [Verrucomicrobiota bacterium]